MKKIFFITTVAAFAFTACNNKGTEKNDSEKMKDTASQTTTVNDSDIKTVSVTYSNVDPKIAASMKEIVAHYLHVKNALASDNGEEAAKGGEAMLAAINKVDKTLLTAEQKTVYDETEGDLKEHAEHIGKSKIDHQREHFAMMSEDMYTLVKAFGGGQTLYHDHCPMYNDNKGALWLSETVEISNPYLGTKMPKCGKVQEKIQ